MDYHQIITKYQQITTEISENITNYHKIITKSSRKYN